MSNKKINNKAIIVFKGKNIRRTWHNKEWWFVVEDIVFVLTNSSDPKGYIKDMRRRDDDGHGHPRATVFDQQTEDASTAHQSERMRNTGVGVYHDHRFAHPSANQMGRHICLHVQPWSVWLL